jgi:hypothetical protein
MKLVAGIMGLAALALIAVATLSTQVRDDAVPFCTGTQIRS